MRYSMEKIYERHIFAKMEEVGSVSLYGWFERNIYAPIVPFGIRTLSLIKECMRTL